MKVSRAVRGWVLAFLTLGLPVPAAAQVAVQGFDHLQHQKLFPRCESCHRGAEPGWPNPEGCATCHDGVIEKRVQWNPPRLVAGTNLRFTHASHATGVKNKRGGDSLLACTDCHTASGAPRMDVKRTIDRRCLDCHGVQVAHLEAPDTSCATCHIPLSDLTAMGGERIVAFKAPPSHLTANFLTAKGHGNLARPLSAGDRHFDVAPSCATCHARDFCVSCHVNAPEVKEIQALAPDSRSLIASVKLEAPANHGAPDFASAHGGAAKKTPQACATCHTRESCLTCHAAQTGVVRLMPVAGPGRGAGASIIRQRPESHGADFAEDHGPLASVRGRSCSTCHLRAECLDCHRPNAAATAEFHPRGFLTRHPAAAYAREADCSDCHNNGAFCQSCHEQAGLVSQGQLRSGIYHDANRSFLLGHGQAARQSLESCVACHAERDCLTCHSAAGGRGFNPHGPGFDAKRLRRKNSESCTACHGLAIPNP